MLLIALALTSGCPATQRAAGPPDLRPARPNRSRVALSAQQLLLQRPALFQPRTVLVHQVAIDSAARSDVVVGQMVFPSASSYRLVAETPFGMRLFSVSFDARGPRAEIAPPLRGRFPAEGLARDIARIYLADCTSGRSEPTKDAYRISCRLADGARVYEVLDRGSLRLRHRTVVEPNGRRLEVSYREYRAFDQLWHPRRIRLRSGDFSVLIVTSQLRRLDGTPE